MVFVNENDTHTDVHAYRYGQHTKYDMEASDWIQLSDNIEKKSVVSNQELSGRFLYVFM